MAHKIFLLSFFILPFFLTSCNTTEPPPDGQGINLTFKDASCIEAWINLNTANLQLPSTIILKQNNETRKIINLDKADTLLYIDSLLPNQQYTFLATIQSSSHTNEVKSNVLSVATLDTTSHNFIWQTWTFGEHSSSVLYDVVIIDENNIWAVGEIYMNDSLGQPDPHAYNAVHWDGTNWMIKRIPFTGSCSAVIYPPIRSIFSFSDKDIWFARGGSLVHFDGNDYFNDCGMNTFLTGSINKIWGTSSEDLYMVGNNGNIAWYNGTSWLKIESGTELHIYDIWGEYNSETMKDEVLCVASNRFINEGNKVLQIEGITVKQVINEGLPWSLNSVWFISERKYFIGGDGLYSTTSLNKTWSSISNLPNYYKTSIRGNNLNDIVVAGAFGLLLHYNGFNWKDFHGITYINGSFTRTDINGNLVVCVGGLNDGQAIILIGRR